MIQSCNKMVLIGRRQSMIQTNPALIDLHSATSNLADRKFKTRSFVLPLVTGHTDAGTHLKRLQPVEDINTLLDAFPHYKLSRAFSSLPFCASGGTSPHASSNSEWYKAHSSSSRIQVQSGRRIIIFKRRLYKQDQLQVHILHWHPLWYCRWSHHVEESLKGRNRHHWRN